MQMRANVGMPLGYVQPQMHANIGVPEYVYPQMQANMGMV